MWLFVTLISVVLTVSLAPTTKTVFALEFETNWTTIWLISQSRRFVAEIRLIFDFVICDFQIPVQIMKDRSRANLVPYVIVVYFEG